MKTRFLTGLAVASLLASTALAGPMEDAAEAYRGGNYEASFATWKAQAEAGDPAAQLNAGILLDQGQGVGQDQAEAAKLYLLAADQGSAPAAFNLGLMYETGEGVDQDVAAAVDWYKKAGEAGDVLAQFKLGSWYENGTNVAADPAEAHKWYMMAAGQKHAPSMFRLASLYTNGLGVEKNLGEANKWNEKADEAQMTGTTSVACNQRSVVVQEPCRRTTPRF